ncbi:mechanosensitive ion channel family protein [Planctomycetota bacterium]
MTIQTLQEQGMQWLVSKGPKIVFLLLAAVVLMLILRATCRSLFRHLMDKRSEEFRKRADTLQSVVMNLTTVTILLVTTLMILSQFGIKIGPILAAAGIVGIAVGFGAQHLIKDLISGFFILLEDQVRVGDVVEIAGKSGLVERMNLRIIVLRDFGGNVHFVPNGEIAVVTNRTKGFSRYVFEIGVAYREDVDQVMEVIKQVDEELRQDEAYRNDILEPIEIMGLDQFANSAVIIKARNKTKPIRQWAVGREFNRRLKKRFDELNIEIPYPHLTLYMGQDKDGTAAPLRIDSASPPHSQTIAKE